MAKPFTDGRSLADIRPSLPEEVELPPLTDSVRQRAPFTGRDRASARDLGVVPRHFFPFVTESDDRVRGPRDLLSRRRREAFA